MDENVITTAPSGLRGVIVADTTVGDVRGEEGFYHYRGYSAVELARECTFEEVWQLMIDGELPDALAAERFREEVVRERVLPLSLGRLLVEAATVGEPMEALRTVLSAAASALGTCPLVDIEPAQRRHDAIAVAAVVPTIVAAAHRLRAGLAPVAPRPDLGVAANLLWQLSAVEPSPEHVAAIERYLVATIDHGFNASTFTARVVASTGADMAGCIVAALGALSGPLHGGAPSRALALLEEIATPDRIDEVVRAKIEGGDKIMGFGHAVYRTTDPRSALLRDTARLLAAGDERLAAFVAFAERTEERVLELMAELKPGRSIATNVEYYAGLTMELCGVPRSMFTPTFAVSRVVGWTANVLEQAAEGRIIRPAARYVGPAAPRVVQARTRQNGWPAGSR